MTVIIVSPQNPRTSFIMHTAFLRTEKACITDEKISRRAYVLWLRKGRPKGCESEILREARLALEAEAAAKTRPRRFFQRARDSFGGVGLEQN